MDEPSKISGLSQSLRVEQVDYHVATFDLGRILHRRSACCTNSADNSWPIRLYSGRVLHPLPESVGSR